MNSEGRLLLNLSDKINLKISEKYVVLAFSIHGKYKKIIQK